MQPVTQSYRSVQSQKTVQKEANHVLQAYACMCDENLHSIPFPEERVLWLRSQAASKTLYKFPSQYVCNILCMKFATRSGKIVCEDIYQQLRN